MLERARKTHNQQEKEKKEKEKSERKKTQASPHTCSARSQLFLLGCVGFLLFGGASINISLLYRLCVDTLSIYINLFCFSAASTD
jgi:hypothetical protein